MLTFSNECLEFALNCIAIHYGRIQSHWHPMHAGSGRHPQASFWSLATLQSLEAATSRTWSKRATRPHTYLAHQLQHRGLTHAAGAMDTERGVTVAEEVERLVEVGPRGPHLCREALQLLEVQSR